MKFSSSAAATTTNLPVHRRHLSHSRIHRATGGDICLRRAVAMSRVNVLVMVCSRHSGHSILTGGDVMKPTTTWILIADGAHARLFANHGPGKGIEAAGGDQRRPSARQRAGARRARALVRVSGSAGDMRHAIEPRTDPHRELKRDFAKHLGKMLDQGLAKKSYDRLVIVAPPQALGDLRHALSEPVKHADLRRARQGPRQDADGGAAEPPRRRHGHLNADSVPIRALSRDGTFFHWLGAPVAGWHLSGGRKFAANGRRHGVGSSA